MGRPWCLLCRRFCRTPTRIGTRRRLRFVRHRGAGGAERIRLQKTCAWYAARISYDYDHWLGAPSEIAKDAWWDQLLYDTEQQYAAGC